MNILRFGWPLRPEFQKQKEGAMSEATQIRNRGAAALWVALPCALLALTRGAAGEPAMQPAANTSLEGDWVRVDTHASGNFGELTSSFEKAALTPEAAAELASHHYEQVLAPLGPKAHAAGEAYIVVNKPCRPNLYTSQGAQGINPDSGAIHIVVSRSQVVIAPERGGARIIYLDGRTHPDLSRWDPTGSGHSVGHFVDGVLHVDTVGLRTASVPGDGWRTPETHLAEEMKVSADGKRLTIRYTYTDPKIYLKPHTYQYELERLPAPSYALEDWCDASDPKEQQSIVPPPQ